MLRHVAAVEADRPVGPVDQRVEDDQRLVKVPQQHLAIADALNLLLPPPALLLKTPTKVGGVVCYSPRRFY